MTRSLTGKVAVVTGAAKGIGAGIAKAMAAAGASVVVNFASDRPGAERVVAEIKAAGGNAFAIQADVSVVAEVEHLFAEAVATFGSLDILVNNASLFAFASLEQTTDEQLRKMLDTNLWGTIIMCAKGDARLQAHWPTVEPVHTPLHASWLNQIEIYFSIVQRKALTPNDFATLAALEHYLLAFQHRYQMLARPFQWTSRGRTCSSSSRNWQWCGRPHDNRKYVTVIPKWSTKSAAVSRSA